MLFVLAFREMDFLEDHTNIGGEGGMGLNVFCFYNEWS